VFVKLGRRVRADQQVPHPVAELLARLVDSELRILARRRARARRRLAAELDEEAMPASKPDPEQLYAQRQDEAWKRQLMTDALGAMRPESAALIRRIDVEGRSNEEVARELGCSANAVGLRLERARAQFSKIIRGLWSRR
jgi:RNA polymerase sigma factor (sigma-70 family)